MFFLHFGASNFNSRVRGVNCKHRKGILSKWSIGTISAKMRFCLVYDQLSTFISKVSFDLHYKMFFNKSIKEILLEIGFIEEIRTTSGNKEVPQILIHVSLYTRKSISASSVS